MAPVLIDRGNRMSKCLSRDELKCSSNAYSLVAEYFHEIRMSSTEGEDSLPEHSKDVLAFFDVDSEYHNGGLWQYFSNRTDDSGVVSGDVFKLSQALETMGATEMGALIEQAVKCWTTLIEQLREDSEEREEAEQHLFEQGQAQIDDFDERFGALYERTVATISNHIQDHASEFCKE